MNRMSSVSTTRHMGKGSLTIEKLWEETEFSPNPAQREAILHTDGPLFLPAGPGSGKTLVLLWRTLNLIVFHEVPPERIYLSTFTEKAAQQLREGLQTMLGSVTSHTGQPYDLTQMYVGTVHSLCRRLIADRRLSPERERSVVPTLLDELGQYFHIYRNRAWRELMTEADLDPEEDALRLYKVFQPNWRYDSVSRHRVAQSTIGFFNRLSEECIEPAEAMASLKRPKPELERYFAERDIDPTDLAALFKLYQSYRASLRKNPRAPLTDFSLLQQAAYRSLEESEESGNVFQYVIIDEYQDTNTIQERIFFKIASGHGNICVVGDDDQALYRFRGATVENFVEFPARCRRYLGLEPQTIPLRRNYRSCAPILEFYSDFLQLCDWQRDDEGQYRVPKRLEAHRQGPSTVVVASTAGHSDTVCAEIADLVCHLLDSGKVQDPNQIAFLFPSLKSKTAEHFRKALKERDLQVYAPRAGRFIEVPEAVDMLGVFTEVFGMPPAPPASGQYGEYCAWLRGIRRRGRELVQEDPALEAYTEHLQGELEGLESDLDALSAVIQHHGWERSDPYNPTVMKRPLHSATGLSKRAQSTIASNYLDRMAKRRAEERNPISVDYVIRRATSADWTVVDLFHRLCGFRHFKQMMDIAQNGRDEGPIYNLSLLSQYLARFTDEYVTFITAEVLKDGLFKNLLFGSYLLALYRLGESEYEDQEHPFPKGRIPFLTIHQSKGLEFPVVVLGNPRKNDRGPQRTEVLVRPFLNREPGEPLDRLSEFDIMRMFYVALSRAENLLILPYFKARGQYIDRKFKKLINKDFPRIRDLELTSIPDAEAEDGDLPQPYSYTGDYLLYKRCPRQYMLFRKYGMVPARSQMMFFGSLVHQTLEDLHNHLIAQKESTE